MVQNRGLVTFPDLLCEDYIPSDVAGREKQIKEIGCCVSPASRKMKPIHSWLYGNSGTGKTLVAKHILKKCQNKSNVDGVYINCWENCSFFSILEKISRELRILGAEKLSIGFKLERFRQFVADKPFLIILDEVDKLTHPESDDVIYNLSTFGNIGLICISKSQEALYALDKRILSRLNARQIYFSSYTEKDLFHILSKRVLFGLLPGTCSDSVIRYIAEIAKGDARVAIQTLRNAAYIAEKENSPAITKSHIKGGFNAWKDLETSYILNRLNSHYRLLYGMVKENNEINSGELWKAYLSECRKCGKHPIAVRTFSEYMNRLIELNLVTWDRALVRGKVRVFSYPG